MPADRQQLNIRTDDELRTLLDALRRDVSAAIGLPLSQADVIRLGLRELRQKYPPPGPEKKKRKSADIA